MRTIHKYPLRVCEAIQTISIPKGYKILCVNSQNDIITIWAEVMTNIPLTELKVVVFATGELMPDRFLKYLSTVFFSNSTVWHVYSVCP